MINAQDCALRLNPLVDFVRDERCGLQRGSTLIDLLKLTNCFFSTLPSVQAVQEALSAQAL
jgi:hypothetical protein